MSWLAGRCGAKLRTTLMEFRMHVIRPIIIPSLLLLLGCVSVQVTPLGKSSEMRTPVPAKEVAIYRTANQVPDKYEEVALLTASGDYDMTNESQMYEAFRNNAGRLGANGVILDATSEPTTGAKVANFFLGTTADRQGKAIAIYILPKGLSGGSVVQPQEPTTDPKMSGSPSHHECVVPFRTAHSIPLYIVDGLITVNEVEVISWPKAEAIQKAEGHAAETTTLKLKITNANQGKEDWNGRYLVTILDEKGNEIGSGDSQVSLGGNEKADTNRVSVKMRVLEFQKAAKIRIRVSGGPSK